MPSFYLVPFMVRPLFFSFVGCSSVPPFLLSQKNLGVESNRACGCSGGLGGGLHGHGWWLLLRQSQCSHSSCGHRVVAACGVATPLMVAGRLLLGGSWGSYSLGSCR